MGRPTQSEEERRELFPTSDLTGSIDELKAEARRCHTPKQFGELLKRLVNLKGRTGGSQRIVFMRFGRTE